MTIDQQITALDAVIGKLHTLEAETKAVRLQAQEKRRELLILRSYSLMEQALLDDAFVVEFGPAPTTDDQWEIDQQKLADLHDPLVYRVEGS